MLTDYLSKMELEQQILANGNLNIYPDTVFFDILSQTSYSIGHYKSPENDEINMLNNNVNKSELSVNNVDMINQNLPLVKLPLNMMPPPPHKIVNYNNNNVVKRYQQRDNTRPRDSYRPISPKEYDSDESCTSYSSRGTPPDNNGIKFNNSRNGTNRLGDQTVMFGKYSQSSPNVLKSNVQYPSNTQQNNNNNVGNYNRNRYYTHASGNNGTANSGNGRQKQHGGNHTHANNRNSMDSMIRRAHGLVERFKSRSELMKVVPHPPGLLNGGPWDQLNQAIWDVFSSKAQKEKTYESKISLWKNIFLYIRKCLNSYALYMVGSTMSGFGLESSDIDMCLLTKPCMSDPRLDSLQHLNSIGKLLVKYGLTADPELILAKVPILKFKDKETGFEIDLNCNNAVGIRNTHLLHCYARLDWRVRPLVIIIKLWAQANHINDAKNMTVSSYSWALMVIHYLQCGVTPPVLPCLHGLVPDIFNSDNENYSMDVQEEIAGIRNFKSDNLTCLGELLTGFLEYYSSFNYNQYAISVRAGCRLPIDECRYMKAPKNDPHQWKFLCIEEPFDFTNTARSVFDIEIFKHIRDVITLSWEELARTKLLNNILPVNFNQNQR